MTHAETTRLAFDVDAALLIELGERLVARRSVALAELIKNAYDADATAVAVRFEDVTTPGGSIVVSDNGSGMSLEAMRRGWMRIATNNATDHAWSARFRRPRTGAKGVGRFACGRLASRLSLQSVSIAPDGAERVSATFDWRDFKPGLNLDDVTFDITREVVPSQLPTGTVLRLDELADTWNRQDLIELHADLTDLMNFDESTGRIHHHDDGEADPGFTAKILAPEFSNLEGHIGDPFKEAAWGLLLGTVTDTGQPRYELAVLNSDVSLRHEPPARSYQDLAGVTFTIRMMVYQGGRFRGSGFSLPEARALGRKRGGVKVYLDGFQVFSYGSPGDDWLDLDQDRARRQISIDDPTLQKQASGLARPMLSLPGNMQLFGAVSLSRDRNPGITVSISRERLVDNDSYKYLKQFVRDGINWMTVCYARETSKAKRLRQETQTDTPTAQNALDTAKRIVHDEPSIPDDTKHQIVLFLEEADLLLKQEEEARISELSMLRVLASAGTTVLIFDHTLRAMAGQLEEIVSTLDLATDFVPDNQLGEHQQSLHDLRSWSSMATGQGSLVGLLVGSDARHRRRSLALRPLIQTLERGFQGYMSRFQITLEYDVPPPLRTPPLFEAEVYAVLLNLLTNSFKAVRDSDQRRVRIAARSSGGRLVLELHDTGVGIPLDIHEDVFEPFVTTSQPDPVLGVGTGLGLKIVRDLTTAWGGSASFIDPSEPWSTTIQLVVPYQSPIT